MNFYKAVIVKLFYIQTALADGGNPIRILPPTGIGNENFTDILNKLYNFGIWAFGALTVIMVLLAAYEILTAGGDSKKFASAINGVKWAVIGFALYLMAGGIYSVIQDIFK